MDFRRFGKFRLDTKTKVLWYENETVDLQLKEIELLCALTERNREVVTKGDLLSLVWADSYVEESNLARHIYQIRRAFKAYDAPEDLIKTIPRRGYMFNGDISSESDELIVERHFVARTTIETIENPGTTTQSPTAESRQRKSPNLLILSIAGLVISFTLIGLLFSRQQSNGLGQIRSVAVLPLVSLNDRDSDKAINLGFADALITNLGKFDDLKVLSTNAVSRVTGEWGEPLEVARRLEVDAVVDGTLQKADGKYRIILRVTRVADGKQIWTRTFDKEEGQIFALQDEMATETALALALNLSLQNRGGFLRHYTENTEAYRAYRSGRYHHLQREFEKAINEYAKALDIDSKYALALAGMADSHSFLANNSEGSKRDQLYEKAKSYALQALALDPNLAEAHASLGWIRRIYDWDWEEAEKHLRRAVELDPNSSVAHQRLAYLYITLGRTEEAVALSKQARQLDPINHSVGWAYYCNRQYAESASEYERRLGLATTVEMQREPRLGIALAQVELGRYDEAIRVFDEAPEEIRNDFAMNVALAIAMERNGQKNESGELLSRLEAKTRKANGRWVRLAYAYSVFGKREEAIAALQKGLLTRDDRLMWLKSTPFFDSIRTDTRFIQILTQMRLHG